MTHDDVPAVMLEHACELLRSVGYASDSTPFVQMGIGIDVGEAFVGNIGQRALFDFTAVGDVVNTASRLQAEAAGGEVVLSQRVADGLRVPVGTRVELQVKGKRDLQTVYRLAVSTRRPDGRWRVAARRHHAQRRTLPAASLQPSADWPLCPGKNRVDQETVRETCVSRNLSRVARRELPI